MRETARTATNTRAHRSKLNLYARSTVDSGLKVHGIVYSGNMCDNILLVLEGEACVPDVQTVTRNGGASEAAAYDQDLVRNGVQFFNVFLQRQSVPQVSEMRI
jgi:hypothetical protein